jgi:hypothetical protein
LFYDFRADGKRFWMPAPLERGLVLSRQSALKK